MWPNYTAMVLTVLLGAVLPYSSAQEGSVQITEPSEDSMDVIEGDDIQLTCESQDGSDMQWQFKGMTLTETNRIIITEMASGPTMQNILRVESATPGDAGEYKCKNPADYFDEDIITVSVVPSDGSAVQIVEPADDETTVEPGQDLNLRCTAGPDLQLIWKHNGTPLEESVRVIITDAQDIVNQITTSMLTRSSVTEADDGSYTCEDSQDLFNKDSITVNVVEHMTGRAGVAIAEPRGDSLSVTPGEAFTLRCEGDGATSSLTWAKDGALVTTLDSMYIISAGEDTHSGIKFSLLTLEDSEEADSGAYSCSDSEDSSNKDTVRVTVGDRYHDTGAPTETRVITLRVGASLNLQCSLEAAGHYQPEWSKDGYPIRTGSKYLIKQTIPTELKIQNTAPNDGGVYRCSFRHTGTGNVAGVVIFNVTMSFCPSLPPLQNGYYHNCPPRPMYGETCSFLCNPGYRLSDSRPLVCERDREIMLWDRNPPICIRLTDDDLMNSIPTSLSHVLLRVGDALKLQCSRGGTWTKHGLTLFKGPKYNVDNTALIVKNTEKSDTGIYDCNILDLDNALIGIKKFNVTTLPCPRLTSPLNGSVTQCSSEPVYGETCVLQCDPRFKLHGSRSRTCELAHSQTQVYWTGTQGECKSSHYSWFVSNAGGQRSRQPYTSLVFILILVTSLIVCL